MTEKVPNGRKHLTRLIRSKARGIGGYPLAWVQLYAKIKIETGRDVLQESETRNLSRIAVVEDIGLTLAIRLAETM